MEAVFLKLVNMSLTASWLVLAVLVLRILLKNAPKYIRVILWGLVGIRLIFPFSLESMFSMIPSSQPLPEEFLYAAAPQVNTGIPVINNAINPVITQSMAPTPGASANPTQIWSFIFSQIWILGLVLMVLYAAISYYLVYRRVAASIRIGKNLRLCDHIESPFILGIIMPQIYLPSELDPKTADLVLAHEYAHLKRKDHWWKPVGFALLCVYWFNPVMWLAYILLCRDIELACDEKVVRELGTDDKKAYSSALLRCSVNRKMIAACPLAFGEVGVKDRIKTVLNYKKPAFWVIVAAVVICIVVAVCFLTDPLPSREFPMTGHNISDMDVDTIVKRIQKAEALGDASAYMNSNNFTLTVDSEFNWVNSQTIRYFFYKDKQVCSAQLRVFPEENQYNLTESSEWVEQKYHYHLRHYLDALKNLPQNAIRRIAPADRYLIELVDKGRPSDYERLITYDANGVCEIEGWFIHLRIMPLHDDGQGYSGTGDETIDLFYGQADNSSAGYITVTETPKYYLTIPCEGVFQIEISTKISSGGCVNADDTCFKKGERVHLEQLDGMEDLRGIHVVVYDRQGVILNVISIPEAEYSQPVNTISEHGWFLGPDGADMEMNAWAAQCWDVLNQIQAMDSYHIRQEWKFEGKNALNDSSNIDYWKSGGTMMRIGHIPDTNETIGYLLSDEHLLVSHDNSDTPNWVPEETLGLLTPKDDLNEILLPWLYQFRWNSDTTKAISRHDHSDGYTIRLKINEPFEKHHVSADSYHVDFTFDQQNRFQYATYHLESADYSSTGVFTVMETSAKEIEATIAAQLANGNPSEQDGFTMTLVDSQQYDNGLSVRVQVDFPEGHLIADFGLPFPDEVVLIYETANGTNHARANQIQLHTAESDENSAEYLLIFDLCEAAPTGNEFCLSLAGFSNYSNQKDLTLTDPLSVTWSGTVNAAHHYEYIQGDTRIDLMISDFIVNITAYKSSFSTVDSLCNNLRIQDNSGEIISTSKSYSGSEGSSLVYASILVEDIDINSISSIYIGNYQLLKTDG